MEITLNMRLKMFLAALVINVLGTIFAMLLFYPAIRLALRYIEAHYREEISQTTVAEAVHLNPSYFSRHNIQFH